MLITNTLFHTGRYCLLLGKVLQKPEQGKMYYRQTVREIITLGVHSIGIVVIISLFMGAVITLQTAYNTDNPIYPAYLIGLGCRDSIILEFSSTMVALILSGKVGSSIASEIGTMRVSEQIDALEIMGVTPASFLIMPKLLAALLFFPFLNLISILVGIFGGYISVIATGVITPQDFVYGLHYEFVPFYVTYSLIKMVVFSFFIITISSYHGFYVKGGALEVGQASTRAVVFSSIIVLFSNLVITQLLLS